MIRLDVAQGSHEWHAARLGLPTASQFHRIISPKTLKPSESASGYLHELLAEWLLGVPLDSASSDFMERGKALEEQAVAWYELQRGVDAERVGFCLTDDRRAGCSPDRLVGEDGGLELKCPSPAVHVGYLLDGIAAKYLPQIHGAMWVTGRPWWDALSYHPDLPPALVRIERDQDYIVPLSEAVTAFCDRLARAKDELKERGIEPRRPQGEPADASGRRSMDAPPADWLANMR